METHRLSDLLARQASAHTAYLEFFRVPSISCGLYVLPAGGRDPQRPHTEDEIYHVLSGRGEIGVGGEVRKVEPGSIVFVPAGAEHRFQSIEEDLKIFVFFAPAEGTAGTTAR